MQILLHAGFHKSGTTSIQQALLEAKKADFIYPPPLPGGPGHSVIAHSVNDQNSPNYDPANLLKMVNKMSMKLILRKKQRLVLSSEDFTVTTNFEAINRLAQKHEVHLVLTRRPVKEALPSWQQELIKQGGFNPYLSNEGLREAEKHMQFNIKSIDTFLHSAKFKEITVISTTSSKPNFIFENFSKILGTKLNMKIENSRLDDLVLEELVKLNIKNPNQTKIERINLAIKLAEKNVEDTKKNTFAQEWEEKEEELTAYFISLARIGFIDFISAE
jgi:hypothetical protein